MRFEQRLDAADRRPGTEARHRGPRAGGAGQVLDPVHARGVDAAQRRHFAAEAQVGRRIAQRAPQLAAAHDPPRHRVGLAEQPGGGREIAFDQRGADAGARHARAVGHQRRDLTRDEAVRGAKRLQRGQVAGAAMAEAEPGTDPDLARAQPRDEDLAHEIVRRHRRHARIEPQQADEVRAQRAQAFNLRPHRTQPRRRRVGGEELARQGFETQRRGRQPQGACPRHRMPHQRPMTQMQAVERTDADDAAVVTQGIAGDVAEQPAHGVSLHGCGSGRCTPEVDRPL